MRLNIISAVSLNYGIGYQGNLLYRIPEDLKRFKEMTTGHTVIMGSRTQESLPKGYLPNRRNIVLTFSDVDDDNEYVEYYHSFDDALEACKDEDDVFVIGGGMVYQTAMEYMKPGDLIHLTEIGDIARNVDTYFPKIDMSKFKTVDDNDYWRTDMKNNLAYRYKTYVCTEMPQKWVSNIFISLPFTGQENTIKTRLENAILYCERLGKRLNRKFNVRYQANVNQIIQTGKSLEGDSYTETMIDDLKQICDSDAVLMCPGWEFSSGCNAEFNLAKALNMDIYYLNSFDV